MKKHLIFGLVVILLAFSTTCFALNRVDISGEYTCTFEDGRVGTMQISRGEGFESNRGSYFTGIFYIHSPGFSGDFVFPIAWNPYEWGLGTRLTASFTRNVPISITRMELVITSSSSLAGTWIYEAYGGNKVWKFSAKK